MRRFALKVILSVLLFSGILYFGVKADDTKRQQAARPVPRSDRTPSAIATKVAHELMDGARRAGFPGAWSLVTGIHPDPNGAEVIYILVKDEWVDLPYLERLAFVKETHEALRKAVRVDGRRTPYSFSILDPSGDEWGGNQRLFGTGPWAKE